jgi:integrase
VDARCWPSPDSDGFSPRSTSTTSAESTGNCSKSYLAHLNLQYSPQRRGAHIGLLNGFFAAIRQHYWATGLPATAMFFAEDHPKRAEHLPRALAEHVMTQLEHHDNLDRFNNPVYRLITVILMRCGLRITDALRLRGDCVTTDADGAPYLRYFNHKMKRDALVPIAPDLVDRIGYQRRLVSERWPGGTALLFPRPTKNIDGQVPLAIPTYREALHRWLAACDIRDEHSHPVHLTPHQWRHTLGTRLINRDVPQEVVRRILDHDSPQMTAHYARLHDTTVRRAWEAARKVDSHGREVNLDPDGPLAEAAWAKQRLGRATQALPNGYCGLPVQQSCPHANACLTCPMFLTTQEFLPQHRTQREQTLQLHSHRHRSQAASRTHPGKSYRRLARTRPRRNQDQLRSRRRPRRRLPVLALHPARPQRRDQPHPCATPPATRPRSASPATRRGRLPAPAPRPRTSPQP